MRSIQRLVLAGLASLALLAPESSAQSCPVHETTIYAGQTTDAGSVRVTNTTDHLVIEVETNASWLMEEVHIYAGVGDPPLNGSGNPNPGQFPYNTTFGAPGEPFHREVIPLADLGVSCGETVDVAVHVSVVELDDQGNLTGRQETGWAYGNKTWPGHTSGAGGSATTPAASIARTRGSTCRSPSSMSPRWRPSPPPVRRPANASTSSRAAASWTATRGSWPTSTAVWPSTWSGPSCTSAAPTPTPRASPPSTPWSRARRATTSWGRR